MGYGMGGGYYGGYGMGMMGGGYYGGMFPMSGPLMEMERQGQMLFMMGSRCIEMLGMVSHVFERSAGYLSDVTARFGIFRQVLPLGSSTSTDSTQSDEPGVLHHFDPSVHTNPQDERKRLLETLRVWLIRLVLFVSLYILSLKAKRLLFGRQQPQLKLTMT